MQTRRRLLLNLLDMKESIQEFCTKRTKEFHLISEERKEILHKISAYIRFKEEEPIALLFVCTHNSRRSMFGQVWAKVAAHYYGFENVETYSGGTEVTALNQNVVTALHHVGFDVKVEGNPINPTISLIFDRLENAVIGFSKTYDDKENPSVNLGAIMTCGHADENCPFIPGAELRIPLTYKDPKISDGTAQEIETYAKRSEEIAREMLYLFHISTK
jgi:arsenate reductase